MSIEIRPVAADRLADLMGPIGAAFGLSFSEAHLDRLRGAPELDYRIGAFDGETIVGQAGSFTFDMTVPGGVALETAGLTIVAVLPTHRRRGILRSMMRRHLDDARARGQALAALYASEGAIYGRFGYGLASIGGDVDLPRAHTAFIGPPAPPSRVRFVSEAEAYPLFASIFERVRLGTPGMLSRSEGWWRARRLSDPESMRGGRGPLQRVILELDGRPAAYAIYRLAHPVGAREPTPPLDIHEAIGDSPAATRAIWRYLFDIDIVSSFRVLQLPPDHALLHLLADPRRLGMRLRDALWVRVVDVGAALSGRKYGEGAPIVIEIEDAFCPWNEGRYRLADGVAECTAEPADLAMQADALGAAFLGGVGFTALAAAGRVVERTPGAARRADVLFHSERAPWSPDTF